MFLVRDGFSLSDIRGYEETTTVEEPRTDLWATLGRVTPRSVRAGMVGVVALGLLLSVETGLVAPVAASLGVALLLRAVRNLPDPEPVTKVLRTRRSGMTEQETMDYLTMSNEIAELKQEKTEEARKEAERNRRVN